MKPFQYLDEVKREAVLNPQHIMRATCNLKDVRIEVYFSNGEMEHVYYDDKQELEYEFGRLVSLMKG